MSAKPLVLRRAAADAIDAATDHYLTEGGADLALRFVAELEATFGHIAAYPAIGSLRYARELGIDGLRHWPMRKFPHLVFYLERSTQIDVLHVLHGQRDIPAWLDPNHETLR